MAHDDQELKDLAVRVRDLEKTEAVRSTEMEELKRQVRSFESGVARGLWLVGGGFIAAIVSWIAQGGLGGKQ